MERMCEVTAGSEYYSTQHFISESPWDYREVMNITAQNVGSELKKTGQEVGLLIDESGHAKKGRHSVGVSRQYSGALGKVDNCQVAVYCGLSSGKYYSLVDTALYLPKEWADNRKRCDKAGIPRESQQYKSKLELALDLVKRQQAAGVAFDYVGGDGLYGNNYSLMASLDAMGITAVFDVHHDQYIYTEPPVLYIPEDTAARGRKHTRVKTDSRALTVRELHATLGEAAFREVAIRQGTKGMLKSNAFYTTVYTWDGKSASYNERVLLIRVTKTATDGRQVKYALTNARQQDITLEELVAMQAQRYFIERSFQESKSDLGLSEYQVRGWRAWHHHMALCIMAQGYVLEEKMFCQDEMPLLSAYDVRKAFISTYTRKNDSYEEVGRQIRSRHKQRAADINNRVRT